MGQRPLDPQVTLGMYSTAHSGPADTCPSHPWCCMKYDGIPVQQGGSVIMRIEKSCDKLLENGLWQESFRTRQCKHEMSPTLRFAKGGLYSKNFPNPYDAVVIF